MTPLSGSLPARSSQGERGKMPQAFCVPNTIGCQPAGRSQGAEPAGWQPALRVRYMESPPFRFFASIGILNLPAVSGGAGVLAGETHT